MKNNEQSSYSSTILILEPDDPTLNLYAAFLGRDFKVISSSLLPSMREMLATAEIHLLIVEPALFGDERWKILHEVTRLYSQIPMIVCTSLDERDLGMKSGATSYLIKPVLPTTLLEVTKNILRQTQQSQQSQLGWR